MDSRMKTAGFLAMMGALSAGAFVGPSWPDRNGHGYGDKELRAARKSQRQRRKRNRQKR